MTPDLEAIDICKATAVALALVGSFCVGKHSVSPTKEIVYLPAKQVRITAMTMSGSGPATARVFEVGDGSSYEVTPDQTMLITVRAQ